MADETADGIDAFAQQLLERAQLRKGAIAQAKGQGSLPLREVQPTNITCDDDEREEVKDEDAVECQLSSKGERRSRLKSLARRINEWEDDMTHYVPPNSRFHLSPPRNSPRPTRPSTASTTMSPTKGQGSPRPTSPTKGQGSPAATSPTKAKVTFQAPLPKSPEKEIKAPAVTEVTAPPPAMTQKWGSSVATKKVEQPKVFAGGAAPRGKVELNTTLAASSLSVAERARLFEQKSAGSATNPFKAPAPRPISTQRIAVASSAPPAMTNSNFGKSRRISVAIPRGRVENSRRLFEGGAGGVVEEDSEEEVEAEEESAISAIPTQTNEPIADLSPSPSPPRFVPPPPEPMDDEITFSALMQDSDSSVDVTPPPRTSPKSRPRSRSVSPQKGSSALPPQSTTPKRAASPSFRRRSVSPDKSSYAGEVKRIKVNDPKPGHIYPSLTDIEATTTEAETEAETEGEESEGTFCADVSDTSSLGAQIERMAKANVVTLSPDQEKSLVGRKPPRPHYRPTEEFSASIVCREIDAMIDSALDGQSFSNDTIMEDASPLESSSPLFPRPRAHQASPATPLMHSVSFFRKQEEQMYVTPKKHPAANHEPEPERRQPITEQETSHVDAVNDLIKKLDEELEAQVRSIAQVSKALNLCKSSIEFSDSTENVECEKVLLLACQKRSAILNEMTRLRTEGALHSKGSFSASKSALGPSCQGNLSLSDVCVELREDFLRNKVYEGESVFHFVALLKERGRVEVSPLVSIGNGRNNARALDNNSILFPHSFTLKGLHPDFKAELEVFVLQTQREFLPHDTKYHIKKKDAKALTPRKVKLDTKFSRSVASSPAGPDAVRTPSFVICGRLTLNISSLGRSGRTWALDGVRIDAPVEGSLTLKMTCSAEEGAEHKGFLTLFDDISGLGAWHRRWASLSANHLSFWIYPEDEQAGKFPDDQISLRHCVTTRVSPVHREVCARTNTLLLVTTREAHATDKESLIASRHGNRTAIRHLLSADTREERDEWCACLNRALANSRAWDPQAASPDDSFF